MLGVEIGTNSRQAPLEIKYTLKMGCGAHCTTVKLPKIHRVAHLKWLNVTVCDSYFSKAVEILNDLMR